MNMKQFQSKIIIFLLVHYTCLNIFAAFKEIYYTARAASMGGAFIAVCDDVDALVFNPAGMTQISYHEVNFTHSKLFYGLEDVNLETNFFGYIFSVYNIGSFGVLLNSFDSSNYKEKLGGMFYARTLSDKISLGIGFKVLSHEYIVDDRARTDPVFKNSKDKTALSLDIGALAKYNSLNLGCSIKNINQPDIGLKTKDIVPLQLGVGLKYFFADFFFLQGITFALDINYRMQDWGSTLDKSNLALGCEVLATKFLDLRLGMNFADISFGFGLRLPQIYNMNFKIDYAFLYPIELKNTSGTHRISLGLQFGR